MVHENLVLERTRALGDGWGAVWRHPVGEGCMGNVVQCVSFFGGTFVASVGCAGSLTQLNSSRRASKAELCGPAAYWKISNRVPAPDETKLLWKDIIPFCKSSVAVAPLALTHPVHPVLV